MHLRALAVVSLFQGALCAAAKPPNIVFLLVDDLGFGDFGCYGAEFHETPNIDQLANEGMRFTNAYAACTVCSPSRAAILSGRYPARLRLTDWITGHSYANAKLAVPDWTMKIAHERVLLPEALKEGGYVTAFFGKWHLMPDGAEDFDKHYPTEHGFDSNVGGREWGQPRGKGKYFWPFDMPGLGDGEEGDYLTDKLTDTALEFLDATEREQPFLLYLSYYTLHGPIMCPPALRAKYAEKAKNFSNEKNEYVNPGRAGMVESLDTSVGRIVAKLEELGISGNTLVVLTGDNGGNFDETTAGLKGYKGFSHEGGTREPFIVKWPGKVAENTTCDVVTIGTDLYPTFLDAAGLPLRPDEHLDGLSIVPLLEGAVTELDRDTLYWHYPHYHRTKPYGAVRSGDWKLIEFFEDGALELYNLKNDPSESRNLIGAQPGKAKLLMENMVAWRLEVGAQMPRPNPDYDPGAEVGRPRRKNKKNAN